MSFDINNIGKLALNGPEPTVLSAFNKPPELRFIVAYDYCQKKYLIADVNCWINIYNKVPDEAKMFTVEEAISYLDEQLERIRSTRETLSSTDAAYENVISTSGHLNYQNELLHLSNAYYESLRQLGNMELYCTKHKDARVWSSCYEVYFKELTATKKAIRRLEKRFHFFFGEEAESIMDCIRNTGARDSINKGLRYLADYEKQIIKNKEKIQTYAEKFAQIRKDNSPKTE